MSPKGNYMTLMTNDKNFDPEYTKVKEMSDTINQSHNIFTNKHY